MMAKDIVFIDTCIYKEENYFDPKNRISELGRLASAGHISLISTEITNREVEMHFKEEASAPFRDFRNNYKVLKGIKAFNDFFDKGYRKKVEKMAVETCEKFREQSHVYTIEYSYCKDVEAVFEKYFNLEKPFAEGKKRKEFPDAFALQMLEEYCKKNGIKEIIVLSNDDDIIKYKSKYLVPTDCRKYLTKKLAEAKTLELIKRAIEANKERLCKDIEEYVTEELDDTRNYNGMFNTEDVSDISVESCTVDMEDDFSIVSEEKGTYAIELHMSCICEVKCSFFSLDYATYDREDGKWYGGEWEIETLTGESYFNVIVHYSEADGDYLDMDMFELGDAVPDMRHSWEH